MNRHTYTMGSASISLTLRADLLTRLNELAQESGMSRNGIIVVALENFLRTNAAREMKRRGENGEVGK